MVVSHYQCSSQCTLKVSSSNASPRQFKLWFTYYFNFICLRVLLAFMYKYSDVSGVLGSQERVPDVLELELRKVVSHSVSAGNWIWVLYKNGTCSQHVSHLRNPCSDTLSGAFMKAISLKPSIFDDVLCKSCCPSKIDSIWIFPVLVLGIFHFFCFTWLGSAVLFKRGFVDNFTVHISFLFLS